MKAIPEGMANGVIVRTDRLTIDEAAMKAIPEGMANEMDGRWAPAGDAGCNEGHPRRDGEWLAQNRLADLRRSCVLRALPCSALGAAVVRMSKGGFCLSTRRRALAGVRDPVGALGEISVIPVK